MKRLEDWFYVSRVNPFLKSRGLTFYRMEETDFPDLIITNDSRVVFAEMKAVNKIGFPVRPKWGKGQLPWIKRHEKNNPNGSCLILYYGGDMFFLPPKSNYTREELVCQKSLWMTYLMGK